MLGALHLRVGNIALSPAGPTHVFPRDNKLRTQRYSATARRVKDGLLLDDDAVADSVKLAEAAGVAAACPYRRIFATMRVGQPAVYPLG